jgi:hypothetical protein
VGSVRTVDSRFTAAKGGALLAMCGFAACLSYYYGRYGLNPVDQPIIFDGGWRILSGQLPFRDFVTPVGITPSVIQALFFSIFGVTWSAYVLHAAAANACFALAAFAIARELGARFLTALVVGAASGVFFYPAFGIPYMDQHSFLFSLCCVWATLIVVRCGANARAALIAAPMLAAAAMLSKIVPATFFAGPCVVVAAVIGARQRPRHTIAGLALPLVLIVGYVVVTHASLHDIVEYTFTLPFRTANARTALYPAEGAGAVFAARGAFVWTEWRDLLAASRFVLPLLWAVAAGCSMSFWTMSDTAQSARAPLIVSLFLAGVTAVFTYVTNNAASNALGLLPLVLGLALVASVRGVSAVRTTYPRVRTVTVAALTVVVFAAGAVDTWRYWRNIVAARALTRFDPAAGRAPVGGALDALVLNDGPNLEQFRASLAYIASRPETFLLFGDSVFLYGATRHPSAFPVLWFHPGLTIPPADTAEFAAVDTAAAAGVRRYDVRYLIQEGGATQMGATLDGFPRLAALVANCPVHVVKWWTVREVCHAGSF